MKHFFNDEIEGFPEPPRVDWAVLAVTVGAVLFGMGLVLQIV